MALNNMQKKYLRGLCHGRSPVVMVADKGLTDNVLSEIDRALGDHELIKVRIRAERERRAAWIDDIAKRTGSQVVQRIGQIACFYRQRTKNSQISLP